VTLFMGLDKYENEDLIKAGEKKSREFLHWLTPVQHILEAKAKLYF
jgi:hypothetical protein